MWRRRLGLLGAVAALCLLAVPAAQAQSPEPKVVGGSSASIATYPWQAAVVFSPGKESGNAFNRQFCGGSLLTSRIVITAGHCVWDSDPDPSCFLGFCSVQELHLDADDVDVVLGRTTLSNTGEGAEMPVMAVYTTPSFQFTGPHGVPSYDVAYLVLGSASGQTPIKIAGTDEGALWDPGSPADVSGWGATSSRGTHVNDLRAATVPIVSDAVCGGDYPGDFKPETMLCAGGGGGPDTCFGDSGGPLEAPLQGGGFRLVGITSWGEACGETGRRGVYTRVAGPLLRSIIAQDVANLSGAYGLPFEEIFGSAQTTDAAPPPAKPKARPFAKCKRIHNKRKRHRCIKRVRKKLQSKSKSKPKSRG